jgi:hypothetical protein
MSAVVCLLVINHIEELPGMAISSILEQCRDDIVVGYLKQDDIRNLPRHKRIKYLDLSGEIEELGADPSILLDEREYVTFDEDLFFYLVQVKWLLLRRLLETHEVVIYTDLDVIWLDDVSEDVRRTLQAWPSVNALVQDFTFYSSEPKLCMGLFAIRRSDFATSLIRQCSKIHADGFESQKKFSDDDAISAFYQMSNHSTQILKLPSQSYPVGNLINILLPVSILRGLRPAKPLIYHANFVVGWRKKAMLMRFVQMRFNLGLSSLSRFFTSFLRVGFDFVLRKF